jgi:glycosyltransferase involved in cell wall biosynthesis
MQTIKKCLDSLMHQTGNIPHEVIVIDSSYDKTPEIVKNCYPSVRFVHLEQKTIPAIARNIGIEISRGEIIAFTDSDCIVDATWIEEIVNAHRTGYDVICGSIINARPGNLISIAEYFLEFREFSATSERRESNLLASCNFSMKSYLFEEAGRFPEIRASEDVFLAYSIREKGIKILFEPKVVIKHLNRNHIRPFLKNQSTLGMGAAITRRVLPLQGRFLVKHNSFAILIPFIRLIKTIEFITGNRFPNNMYQFLNVILSLPFYIFGSIAYSIGFSRGIRAPEATVSKLRKNL